MSWGNMFDGSGSSNFGDDGPEDSYNSGMKRQMGSGDGGSSGYKKMRSDSYGDSSYDDGGYGGGGGGNGDNYGDGGYDDGFSQQDQGDSGSGMGDMTEITSWDQIATKKPARDSGGRGGRGRGGGRGGRGGGGGGGSWGGGSGGGRSGGGGYGGGGKQFGNRNDNWGSSQTSVDSGGNFDAAVQRGFGGSGFTNKQGFGGGGRGGGGGGGGGYGGGGGGYGGGGGGYGGGGGGYGGGGGGYGGGGGGYGGGGGGGRGGRGGRGRGGDQGRNRAFTPGFNRNAGSMTLVQKFEKYMQFLKGDTARVNAIQSVENACLATGLHLKCDYHCDELPRIINRQLFTGRLCVSGIYLARSVGCNKKEMKHEVYKKALDILSSKTLAEINELKDPGLELVRASVEKYLKDSGPGTYQEGVGVPIYKQMNDVATEVAKHLETAHRMQTGLVKVIETLKGNAVMAENPISKIEQALIKSRAGLRHIFTSENIEMNGKYVFEGCFIVEDTCIARSYSPTKKQCKTDTYTAALEALTNKSFTDLVVPVEREKPDEEEDQHVQNEAIVAGVQQAAGEGPPPITKPSLVQAPLEDRLKNMCTTITNSAFSENNMGMIDNCMFNSGLTATCLYRRRAPDSDEVASCELYVDNILLAIGYGNSKVECANEAYNIAFETVRASTPDEILANHKKLPAEDTKGPTVLECLVKGATGLNRESNSVSLRRYGFDPEDTSRASESMVIMEASNWHTDRRSNAFCLLQYSTTHNGILLQWTFTPLRSAKKQNYKHEGRAISKLNCEIFINGNKVSEHSGYGKNKIRNFASADILYRLYETCDVIRVLKLKDSERWIPFSILSSEADALRNKAGQKKPVQATQASDKFLVQAARQHIDNFFPSKDGAELLFGPGLPEQERLIVRDYAKSKNLLWELRQHNEEAYDAIFERLNPQEVVKTMKTQMKPTYGKYKLVEKSECPTHADLTGPKSKSFDVKVEKH